MSDQQHGFALDPALQFLPQNVFAAVVHGAGRFVEQQDRRVEQQGPGQQYGLALTAGEQLSAFADGPIKTLRVLTGQLGDTGQFRDF